MTDQPLNRRRFVQAASAGTAAFWIGNSGAFAANDKLRVGAVGVGGRGTSDLKGYSRLADFDVAAICDLRPERVERAIGVAKESGHNPKGYTDLATMLEKEKLDAAIVCTEVGNHGMCVIPCLEAGLNVFSEKPMESNVEKVDAVVNAARKAKGIYQIGFQRRYNPTFLTTIPIAQGNTFGKITFLQAHWYFSGGVGGWVLNVDISGGKLVEQACHHMDVMNWVMGNTAPVKCEAMGTITVSRDNPPEHEAEDHSSLNFEFPNGVILSYTHFSYMPPDLIGEKLWVFKEGGIIDLAQGMKHPRSEKEKPERVAEATDYYDGSVQQFESFAKDCRSGNKPASNIETGRISSLMAIMGHKAMYNRAQRKYEPSPTLITWKDLGTTTDPV